MSFLKNRTVVGVICILLSLLICFGLTPLFNRAVSQKAEIIRVVQPIRTGDKITESMVQTVEVGGYNLPEDVLRQKESAVGKYATADLAVGDYIIPTKLSDAPAAENAYLYNLDGSQQAISVSIKSFAEGLSGKLQSGDIVSVIAPDYKQQGQTVVPAELQYVEVISVTASSGYDANTGEPAADEKDDKELPGLPHTASTPPHCSSCSQASSWTVPREKMPAFLKFSIRPPPRGLRAPPFLWFRRDQRRGLSQRGSSGAPPRGLAPGDTVPEGYHFVRPGTCRRFPGHPGRPGTDGWFPRPPVRPAPWPAPGIPAG